MKTKTEKERSGGLEKKKRKSDEGRDAATNLFPPDCNQIRGCHTVCNPSTAFFLFLNSRGEHSRKTFAREFLQGARPEMGD